MILCLHSSPTSITTSKAPIENRRYDKTEMSNNGYKDQIFSNMQQWLTEVKLLHQACIDRITSLEHKLDSMTTRLTPAGTTDVISSEQEKIMVANGRRLGAEESPKQIIDDYDVILDLTVDTLQVRISPETHSKLLTFELTDLTNVGPHRIKLLAYMLEHPGSYVSVENAAICHGAPDERREPATLRKTISLLRQALGTPGPDNPYIKTRRSTCPCAYALNRRWRYLLIKWKN